MPRKVFVSYSHQQGEWVLDRLVPVLKAGGAEVLIDRERFRLGLALFDQMDALQDQADVQLLCLSEEYLASEACQREMERAIARDPEFTKEIVIPIRLSAVTLPQGLARRNPLYADLRDGADQGSWVGVLRASMADLGTGPPEWLDARDEVRRLVEGGNSVNLVACSSIAWQPIVRELVEGPFLGAVVADLARGAASSRRGLVEFISRSLGCIESVISEHDDLVFLDQFVSGRPGIKLVLLNFQFAVDRSSYGRDFFLALRNLVQEQKALDIFVHSSIPYDLLSRQFGDLARIFFREVRIECSVKSMTVRAPCLSCRRLRLCDTSLLGQNNYAYGSYYLGAAGPSAALASASRLSTLLRRSSIPRRNPLVALLRAVRKRAQRAGRLVVRLVEGTRMWWAGFCAAMDLARRSSKVLEIAELDSIWESVPNGQGRLFDELRAVRLRVREIVEINSRLGSLRHPSARAAQSVWVFEKLKIFQSDLRSFRRPFSTKLRHAVQAWEGLVREAREEALRAACREARAQVFRAGDPVDREENAFACRSGLMSKFEELLDIEGECPPVVIYSRRRMGKTTFLLNLQGIISSGVFVATLSMQQARAFSGLDTLVGLIAERVLKVLSGEVEDLRATKPENLEGLEAFLWIVNERLTKADRRLLLVIDEYENLDVKIGEGVMPVDLLAVVRESIQNHRRIIWAFAGSHRIDELTNAPWTSYLVSARTVEIPPFEPEETRLLLTEPLKYSTLFKDHEAKRPRFQPGFWGPGGIERIHTETGGWPHLVQLVAEAVVDLVNDRGAEGADEALLEKALDKAVGRGDNVLMELVERESRLPGEWDYVRAFRTTETQPIPDDEAIARSLRRRLLVTEEAGGFRLRVPLMGRWLRQRV